MAFSRTFAPLHLFTRTNSPPAGFVPPVATAASDWLPTIPSVVTEVIVLPLGVQI